MQRQGPVFTPWGRMPERSTLMQNRDVKERQYEPGDLEVLRKGFQPYTDPQDNQYWLSDSQGNKICFADTSSGDVAITLPSAGPSVGLCYKVKRTTGGINSLTVTADSGNIDGTATVGISTQYTCLQMVSDGENWWIV